MIKQIASYLFLFLILQPGPITGQENKLQLPNPLITLSGEKVQSQQDWQENRRPEILKLFQTQMYGKVPQKAVTSSFQVDFYKEETLCESSRSKSITASFFNQSDTLSMNIMIYLPRKRDHPIPLFLGLNFYGNHTVHVDPGIPISGNWVPDNVPFCIFDNQADSLSRGVRANRWPVERILERGYGLAVIYSGDLDPDFDDGFQNGLQPLFYEKNQQSPADEEWGTIGAWAWGLSRAMDYFEQDADIDQNRVAVIGHSRLGKAALWAGAQDERFAVVISNNSGCGGAALSKRKSGETVKAINDRFPHWFCKNFHQYNGKEELLPLDQHMLIALMAPRPVYVASAQEDDWADPQGEYLSLYHAAPVYNLFGHSVNLSKGHPEVNEPVVSGPMGYHIRSGRHDITRYDWEQYLDFADQQFDEK